MNIDEDLDMIARQELALQFEAFDETTAWEIGTRLRAEAVKRKVAVEIDVTLGQHRVFTCAMPGTSANNADWIRRKINVVGHFQRSSYAVGRQLDREGVSLEQKYALPPRDFAAAGGCFPLRVRGAMVGTVTVSGLPQRDDHALVVSVLSELLGQPGDNFRLD